MVDTIEVGRTITYLIKDEKEVDWILISVINDCLKKIGINAKIKTSDVRNGVEVTVTTKEDD